MMTARKAESLEAAAKEVDGEVAWHAGHAGRPEDIEACADATLERFGRIDVLVNNAATNPYAGPTIDVDLPRWDKTFETNLRGPLLWSQVAWRKSMRDHGGSIINVASVGGLATNPILGVYDVTKAALLHLTKQLAAELAPGVRVNAIAPGLIKTDFARVLWEGDRGDQVARSYPLKRLGEVEDIAHGALFLASEMSSWMTGQTLVFDGGGLIAFSR
jgi:NAD(P)-dependent dehydrogenase (short-subunit alcohol dehydrogenase family)